MVNPIVVSGSVISDMEHMANIERIEKRRGISQVWKYSVSSDGLLEKTDYKIVQLARFIFGYLRSTNSDSYRQKLEKAFFEKNYNTHEDSESGEIVSSLSGSEQENILKQLRGELREDQVDFMKQLNQKQSIAKPLTNQEWEEGFHQKLSEEKMASQESTTFETQFERDQKRHYTYFEIEVDGKKLDSRNISQDGREIKEALGEENKDWHEAVLLLASQ